MQKKARHPGLDPGSTLLFKNKKGIPAQGRNDGGLAGMTVDLPE